MSDGTGFKYDVFISYRWVEPDMSWVRQKLYPALKNAGLKVFLDVNDFEAARHLIREMTRAATESRRTICVISPDYFDGNRMVAYESLTTLLLDPSGSDARLIPLLFRATNIPQEFRGLIPIDWTDYGGRSREWNKLLRALGANKLNAPDPETLDGYQGLSQEEVEILNILWDFNRFDFYTFPNIPEDTLATAGKICRVPDGENILGLIELGIANDYLLFGRKGIYFRCILNSLNAASISYDSFPARIFDWGKNAFDRMTRKVTLGNSQFVIATHIPPHVLVEMLNAIKEAVNSGNLDAPC